MQEANLLDPNYVSINDLESYAENTASSVNYLLLEALDVKSRETDHIASHIGKATGISTVLRGLPEQLNSRRMYLPSEVLSKVSIFSLL